MKHHGSMAGLLLACLLAVPAYATPWLVQVDTSALSGTSAQLAFDFIDGGPPANSATITAFTLTGGMLVSESSIGDVAGSLGSGPGVAFADGDFFNEHLAGVTLGSALAFRVETSGAEALLGSFPDSFSFLLLDPATGLPLFATADPAGALLVLAVDGSAAGHLSLFQASGGEVLITASAVPELPAASLALLGLAALTARRHWRRGAAAPRG